MQSEQPPRTRVSTEGVAARAVHLTQCKLVVLKGSQRGKEFVISGDVIRIGKVEGNDLVLPEETVSRVHCEILRDAKGHLLRDLQSTNGTFLDGAEIREAYIRAGSVITIGAVQLKFQPFEERIEILPSDKEQLGEMVGSSLKMREIFGLTERIAPTEATVLIEGETGTGKDMVARTIHALSKRKDQPFVVVDCGAVSGTLIESELFGHEKGAFTGATTTRQGAFELAHGGTIFLDELGELSLDLQPKLLRVLEQREIRRVGGNRTIKIDIRVVAATKQDLQKEVQKGKFREDLYFRLSVVPIHMPSVRERKEDIPLIVRAFLAKMAKEGAPPREMDDATIQSLMSHDWPGNVRELRNVLERGVYLSPTAANGSPVKLVSMPSPHSDGFEATAAPFQESKSYRENKEQWENEFEKRYLTWLMERAQGNISRAAREADMDRKYLHKLLKKHAILS
ncbi:MAG: sigma54 specific transcriptional regulator, Fis family [Myxococcales bacterium]|nr:sigma54 specific transcriptional regulator, Fis family [Myxococcales bacterium]